MYKVYEWTDSLYQDFSYHFLKKKMAVMQQENFENFILFNVKNPNETYSFANDLKNEIIKRSSEEMAVSI